MRLPRFCERLAGILELGTVLALVYFIFRAHIALVDHFGWIGWGF